MFLFVYERDRVQSCNNILYVILSTAFGPGMIVVAIVVFMCLVCFFWVQLVCSVAILISHSESMRV